MCQSLVAKITQSEQLRAMAAPEVLILFEDWMEELEREVLSVIDRQGQADQWVVAEELGLSRSGAQFLITKLENEGKL